jgi:hypothetical protein
MQKMYPDIGTKLVKSLNLVTYVLFLVRLTGKKFVAARMFPGLIYGVICT